MPKCELAILIALLTACAAATEDILEDLAACLGDDSPQVRIGAQETIEKYLLDHGDSILRHGARLYRLAQEGDNEKRERIRAILGGCAEIRALEPIPTEIDHWVGASFGCAASDIKGVPLSIVIVDSKKMLDFWWTFSQQGSGRKACVPQVDLSRRLLVSIATTSTRFGLGAGQECTFADWELRRDFARQRLVCTVSVTVQSRIKEQRRRSGYCGGLNYDVSRAELPLFIRHVEPGSEDIQQMASYGEQEVKWPDLDTVIKEGNIWAMRRLAETCTKEVEPKARRTLVAKGCLVDPLLPYVLFSHLALNHAAVFDEERAYWQNRMEDIMTEGGGLSLRALAFRKALEYAAELRGAMKPELGKGCKP